MRLLLCSTLLALCCWLTPAWAHALEPGGHAPAIDRSDLHGHGAAIAKGKITLVDIWASWCEPCKHELPALEKIYQRHHAAGFRVIAVNIDKELPNVQHFLDKHPVSFTVVHDPDSSIAARYAPATMPGSFLIDHLGIVRKVYRGYHSGDDAMIERDVVALLAALPASAKAARVDKPVATASDARSDVGAAGAGAGAVGADAEPASPVAAEPPAIVAADTSDQPAPAAPAPKPVEPSAAGRRGGLCSVQLGGRGNLAPGLVLALLWLVRRRRA